MRKFLTLCLLVFGLATLGAPTLVAGTPGLNLSLMADGNDYDTGGG